MNNRMSWPAWAMGIARSVAARSEDPYCAVGAVALREDWSVAGVGYNGAPSGVNLDWTSRELRRDLVIHAEVNALRYSNRLEMQGGFIVTTHIPCSPCLTVLASYHIGVVYYCETLGDAYDHGLIHRVANSCGITLIQQP